MFVRELANGNIEDAWITTDTKLHPHSRVSFRIFVKGWANATIAELRVGEDYSNTSNAFSLAKNIIELIDFLKLGGSGGMLSQEIFLFFSLWDCFWWLLRPNFQDWGEVCCLYTVASVNRSVNSMYTLPQGIFWRFKYMHVHINRIVHEHIHVHSYVYLLEDMEYCRSGNFCVKKLLYNKFSCKKIS